MHPVANKRLAGGGFALGNFAFMMGERVFNPAAVDVERFSQVLHGHGGALDVPAGIAFAPGAGPLHDVPRFRSFPQRKIQREALFGIHLHPGPRFQFLQLTAAQFAIFRKFAHIVVHGAVDFVREPFLQQFLHQFNLFNNMPGGVG